MLKEYNLNAALPLAEKLSQSGLQIEAVRESPLARAIDACYHPSIEEKTLSDEETEEKYGWLEALMNASAQTAEGKISHDEVIENVIEVVGETVSNTLNLARNVVNPTVKDVVNFVEDFLRDSTIEAVNFLSVVPFFYRKIWNSPVIDGMVSKYGETSAQEVEFMNMCPERSPEDVAEMLKTGTARFDNDLEDFVENVGLERVYEIYKECFEKSTQPSEPTPGRKLGDYTRLGAADPDAVLIIHLIARRLYKEPPEDVAIPLAKYREFLSTVIAQSGRALIRILERREKQLKRKELGIQYGTLGPDVSDDPSSNIIYVNGDVYNDWLKEGGQPEVLFGAALTDKATDYQMLLEKKDYYLKVWARQARLRETKVTNQRFSLVVTALRKGVAKQINNLNEDEEIMVTDKGTLHSKLEEVLATVTPRMIEDLYYTARCVVCRTMFAHAPDAERILESIDQINKKDPELEPREAALYATVDLVVDWLAEHIQVSKVETK